MRDERLRARKPSRLRPRRGVRPLTPLPGCPPAAGSRRALADACVPCPPQIEEEEPTGFIRFEKFERMMCDYSSRARVGRE